MNPLDMLFSNFAADDLSIRFFQTVLGPLFGIKLDGFAMLGVLAGAMNGFIMATAAIWMGWLTISVIADGAYSGEIGGKTMHKLWGPLRVAVGFGAIVPLGSGFNLLQHMIAGVAVAGISFANYTWDSVVDGLIKEPTPVAFVYDVGVESEAFAIADIAACSAFVNLSPSDGGGPTLNVRWALTQLPSGLKLDTHLTERGAARYGDHKSPCGSLTITWPDNRKHREAIEIATLTAILESGPVIEKIMDQMHRWIRSEGEILRYINNGAERFEPPGRDEFVYASLALQAGMQRARNAIYSHLRSNQEKEEFAEAMKHGGWVKAGAWYRMFSEESVRMNEVVDFTTSTTPPNWTAFRHAYVGIYDTNHLLEKYNAYKSSLKEPDIRQRIRDMNRVEGSVLTDDARGLLDALRDMQFEIKMAISEMVTGVDGTGRSPIGDALGAITGLGARMASVGGFAVIVSTQASVIEAGLNSLGWIPLVGTAAAMFGKVTAMFSSFIMTAGLALLIPGMILYAVLPLLPALYFLVTVISWALMVLEAVLIAPLWALAHLRLDGTNFAGESALKGYGVMMNILFRPVLIVGGFILGIAAFTAAVNMITPFIGLLINVDSASGFVGLLSWFTSVVLIGLMFFWVAEKCFSLIHVVPDNVSHWLPLVGGQMLGEKDERSTRALAIGGIMQSRELASGAGAGLKKIGDEAANEINKRKSDNLKGTASGK